MVLFVSLTFVTGLLVLVLALVTLLLLLLLFGSVGVYWVKRKVLFPASSFIYGHQLYTVQDFKVNSWELSQQENTMQLVCITKATRIIRPQDNVVMFWPS